MVEDVEITAPHVCIVMKRPPEPMHISRNIGKYPPKESLSSALWTTEGKDLPASTEHTLGCQRASWAVLPKWRIIVAG